MGERKQALAEYQTKRANQLREAKRQENVRAKDGFVSLLTQVIGSNYSSTTSTSADSKINHNNNNTTNTTNFTAIRPSLVKDDRYYAVEDDITREEFYYEFCEELRKRDER